jgi:hypothetical protein
MTDIIVDHLLDARQMQLQQLQAACSTLAGSDHWRILGGTPGYEEQPFNEVRHGETRLDSMIFPGSACMGVFEHGGLLQLPEMESIEKTNWKITIFDR